MKTATRSIFKILIALSTCTTLTSCSGGSSGADTIDKLLGAISGNTPVLTAVPTQVIQQTQTLTVDVNNVKVSSPGTDSGMTYSCTWDRTIDGSVSSGDLCSSLPGGNANFSSGTGTLTWTPTTAELGQFEIKISGTNSEGTDNRIFLADVRLFFAGLDSITNVQGDRMTLNWTANTSSTGYQILKRNADGTYSVFQTITNPNTNSVTLTGLAPLQSYTWKVAAIDSIGALDGNSVSLTAVTSDLIRLEVTSSASQLSPGQSTTVTVKLKDNNGNYLSTSGLTVGLAMSGTGTSSGTFSAVTDLGNGIYTAVFTATTPGTLNPITASLTQFYYVETTAAMTVRPLQIEITTAQTSLNPGESLLVTAKIRDFNGNLMSSGGHALAFAYSGGTSTLNVGAATDLGTGIYTATLTGNTAGTAVTLSASISTTSSIYSTTSITVIPFSVEVTSALTDVSVTRTTTITGKIKDWHGNYLTTGGKGLTLAISGSAGIATLGSTTDNSNGTYTATLTGSSLGSVNITASITPSHTVTATANVNIKKLRLEIITSSNNLMPGQVANLTGRVKDWQGNVIGVGGQGFDFITSGGTSSGTMSTVTDNSNGTYSATYTASAYGTTLTVTGNISESFQVDTTTTLTVHRWRVYVSTSATAVPAGQNATVTITVKDYLDVQASAGGQTVSLVQSGGTSSGTVGSTVDNGDGTYTIVYTGVTTGTASTISASLLQSYQVIQTASITVGSIYLSVTVQNPQINPSGTSYVYAQVKNSVGTNLTTGSYAITFSYSGGTSSGSFSAVSDMGGGLYRATFTGANGGTAVTITAAANMAYVVSGTQNIQVVPWVIDISTAATSLTVGQTTTVTAKIKDYTGAYLTSGGYGVALSLATTGVGSLSAVTDNSNGTYTATFSASGVGSTQVSPTISSSFTIGLSPSIAVTALHIAVTAVQTSLNPGDGITIQAQMKDALGNSLLTGSYTIAFSASGGTSTGSVGSTLNLGLGAYSATFTGNIAGTATTLTASASVPFVVDSTASITVVPWDIVITTTSTALTINENATISARLKNWQGNYVTTGGKGVNLALTSAGAGTLSATIDGSNGYYTATFNATSTGSTSLTASMAQSYSISAAPTLTVGKIYISVTLGAGSSSTNVNSGSTIIATATIRNSLGGLVTGTGYSITFAATGGTSTVTPTTSVSEVSTGVYQMTYQGVLAGTALTISASSSQSYILSTTAALTVLPSTTISATTSTLSSSASTVQSGASVTITTNLKDAAGNTMPGLSGVTLAKTSGGSIGNGNFSAITDAGNGTYTATFTGSAQGTTPVTISASYGGVTVTQTANVTVTSGVPSKLTLNGPTSINANSCSAALSLSFYDGASNSTTLPSSTSFTIAPAKLSYGMLFSDSSCTSQISTIDVASGASQSQNFYFKSYYPGAYNLIFSASGITQTNTAYSLNVYPVLSWIGISGVLDLNVAGQLYATGIYDGTFNYIQGLTFHNAGSNKYLYVADNNNHSIQKIDITNPNAISIVGAIGKVHWNYKGVPTGGGYNSSYCTSTSPGTGISGGWCTGGQYQSGSGDASMNNPFRSTVMNISGTNYLFVSDNSNHRILKYNADTGSFLGWTGLISTSTGMTGACLTAGPGATTPGWCLAGTATASTSNGAISGANTGGSANGGNQFRNPNYITNDGTYLYINDSGNNRIVKLDPTTGLLVHWMGRIASASFGGANGTTTPSSISCLTTTHSDGSSTVAAGMTTPSWCSGGASNSTALSVGAFTNGYLNPQMNTIRSITFTSDGTYNWMLVIDSSQHRLTRFFCGASTATPNCADNSAITINSTSYYPGQFFGWTGWVSNAINSAAVPTSIAGLFNATSAGSTGVSTNGWAYYGSGSSTSNTGGLSTPLGLTINSNYMYVADYGNDRIARLDWQTGRFNSWVGRVSGTPSSGVAGCAGASAGTITPGWCAGGSSTNGNTLGAFYNIYDIQNDGTNLYSVDRANSRIVINNMTTGAVVGAIGLRINTQVNNWNANGYANGTLPTSTNLNNSVVDRDKVFYNGDQLLISGNYLYASDTSNHRIKRYSWLDGSFQGWIGLTQTTSPTGGDTNCIGTLVGGFTPGWCKGGGYTSSASFGFNNPRGMASDGTYLYVADSSNHRIVKIRISDAAFMGWIGYISTQPSDGDSGCSIASAGTATPGWCLGGSSASSNILGGFNTPQGLAGFTDSDNKFYLIVGDSSNNRLQKIEANNPSNAVWVGRNSSGSTACGVANGVMLGGWCATSNVASSATNTTSNINNGFLNTTNSLVVDTSTTPYYIYVTSNSGRVLRFDATSGSFEGWIGSFGGTTTNASCISGVVNANAKTPSWCYGGQVTTGTSDGQMSNNVTGVYSDGSSLYVSDTSGFRIMKYNRTTGAFIGWVGKVYSNSGMGGPSTCSSTANRSVTPSWCTGGAAMGGFELDTANGKAAFDQPRGLSGFGSYLLIMDSANGRILSMPSN